MMVLRISEDDFDVRPDLQTPDLDNAVSQCTDTGFSCAGHPLPR